MYIGICEDEKVQIEYLVYAIEKYHTSMEVSGSKNGREECRIETFQNAEELLFKYEQALPFDCLILDIKMGKMDGMELAADIRKRDKQIPIIFVTGDRDAVFDGYKVGAVRYLLKPIKQEMLAEALECVKGHYITIRVLSDNNEENGNGKSVYKEFTFKESMKGIKEQLDDRRYVQASRSVLVNMEHVESITRTECTMDNEDVIALSRSCYNDFNQAYLDI